MPDVGPSGRPAVHRQPLRRYATALAGCAGVATVALLALPVPAYAVPAKGAAPGGSGAQPANATAPDNGPDGSTDGTDRAKPDPAKPGSANPAVANSGPVDREPANAGHGSGAGAKPLTAPATNLRRDSGTPGRPSRADAGRDSGRTRGEHGRTAEPSHPGPKGAGAAHRRGGDPETRVASAATEPLAPAAAAQAAAAGSQGSTRPAGTAARQPDPDAGTTNRPTQQPTGAGNVDLAAAPASGSTVQLGLRLFVAGFIALLCSVFGLSAIALRRAWQPQR